MTVKLNVVVVYITNKICNLRAEKALRKYLVCYRIVTSCIVYVLQLPKGRGQKRIWDLPKVEVCSSLIPFK
jgi:hypothetical protein